MLLIAGIALVLMCIHAPQVKKIMRSGKRYAITEMDAKRAGSEETVTPKLTPANAEAVLENFVARGTHTQYYSSLGLIRVCRLACRAESPNQWQTNNSIPAVHTRTSRAGRLPTF